MVAVDLLPPFGSDHLALRARVRLDADLAAQLNTPPPPPDPEEEARLDGVVETYARNLAAARRGSPA
jgi:hypothetical protein